MARAAQSTRPIQVLQDAIRSLEAAALVCLASPKKKPVHHLRTWTRRIEAQLELIAMLPEVPRAPTQCEKALSILKKLRREAGRVRDLDVERDLIAEESAHAKGSSRAALAIRKEARELRRDLKRQREDEADALVALLKKERKKLPLALKELSDAFGPANQIVLTEEKLITLVREWYGSCKPQRQPSASGDINEALHTIRKRAKHARYMAESAPDSAARAHRLAAHFEALQQAGGNWHDWLQLCQVARKELGKSAQLPQRFAACADRSLRSYKRKLDASRKLAA